MAGFTLNAMAALAQLRLSKHIGKDVARQVSAQMRKDGNGQYAEMKKQVAHMNPDFMGGALLKVFLHSVVLYRTLENILGADQAKDAFRKFMHPMMKPIFSMSMRPVKNKPNAFEEFKRLYIKANKPLTMMKWKVVESSENVFQADFSVCGLAEAGFAVGSPEVTKLFCEYDEVYFGAYDPRLTFVREETLARENDRCTFRFLWDETSK